jgi:hypothetical protein
MVPWRGLHLRVCLFLVVLCAVLPMVGLLSSWWLKMVDVQAHAPKAPWVWARPCLSC